MCSQASCRKIVGLSRWMYPVTLSPEQAKEKQESESKRTPYPVGANSALLDDFFTQLFAARKKWVDTEKMFRGSTSIFARFFFPALAESLKTAASLPSIPNISAVVLEVCFLLRGWTQRMLWGPRHTLKLRRRGMACIGDLGGRMSMKWLWT